MQEEAKILMVKYGNDCETEITGKTKDVVAMYSSLTNNLLEILVEDMGMSKDEAIELLEYAVRIAVEEEV